MHDIFEQAKRDALLESVKNFYFKNKKICKNTLTTLTVLLGVSVWWSYEKVEQKETSSLTFFHALQVLESNDESKALTLLENMPSKYETNYTLLSKFLAANLFLRKNEAKKASDIYQDIYQSAEKVYADLAYVKYLYIQALDMPCDDALNAINAFLQRSPAWKNILLELKGMILMNAGKKKDALKVYDSLLQDQSLTKDSQMRLQILRLSTLNSEAEC